jgi:hypothetical protein
MSGAFGRGRLQSKNPITGAVDCARAASGHAAVNSRRLINHGSEPFLRREMPHLPDHLVGGRQQRFRDGEAEGLGGQHVNDELEPGRLRDR